jgi:thioredoxin 1
MSARLYKTLVLLAVAAALALGLAYRLHSKPSGAPPAADTTPPAAAAAKPTAKYPAVIDLGMGKCIPCKQMKPILDELKQEYAGRCRIEIIDIGERPEQADRYRVNLIPTQVFLGKNGKELFRHEGFMPKADIVAKLREMGVE